MKRLSTIMLLLVVLAGCDGIEIRFEEPPGDNHRVPAAPIEYPTVNLPVALRQANWRGSQGEGSYVHASMISLFRWQGRYAMADRWRRTYGDGEWAEGLVDKMDRENIRFAYTVGRNDVSFLEWACRTRRGCGVTVLGGRQVERDLLPGEEVGLAASHPLYLRQPSPIPMRYPNATHHFKHLYPDSRSAGRLFGGQVALSKGHGN